MVITEESWRSGQASLSARGRSVKGTGLPQLTVTMSVKRLAGTAGVPPAMSAKREQSFTNMMTSFWGPLRAGTPAVPANPLS